MAMGAKEHEAKIHYREKSVSERLASVNIRVIPRLDIKGPNLVKGIHLEGLRIAGKRIADVLATARLDLTLVQKKMTF